MNIIFQKQDRNMVPTDPNGGYPQLAMVRGAYCWGVFYSRRTSDQWVLFARG